MTILCETTPEVEHAVYNENIKIDEAPLVPGGITTSLQTHFRWRCTVIFDFCNPPPNLSVPPPIQCTQSGLDGIAHCLTGPNKSEWTVRDVYVFLEVSKGFGSFLCLSLIFTTLQNKSVLAGRLISSHSGALQRMSLPKSWEEWKKLLTSKCDNIEFAGFVMISSDGTGDSESIQLRWKSANEDQHFLDGTIECARRIFPQWDKERRGEPSQIKMSINSTVS